MDRRKKEYKRYIEKLALRAGRKIDKAIVESEPFQLFIKNLNLLFKDKE